MGNDTESLGSSTPEEAEGPEEQGEDAFDDPRISILDASLDHIETHG